MPPPSSTFLKTRIDAPHRVREADAPSVEAPTRDELRLLAGMPPDGLIAEQVERQAMELGERLQRQQRELARREAEFHANVAELESELRAARLVCRERELELNEKRSRIEQREQQLSRQTAEAQATQSTTAHAAQAQWEGRRERPADIDQAAWQPQLAEWEQREQLLQSRTAELSEQSRCLEEERCRLLQRLDSQRRSLEMERRDLQQRYETELTRLQESSEELQRREAAVRQLQINAAQIHRDALEMRLCAEQMLSDLGDRPSPATVTRRTAELRQQLEEQFQLAGQSIADQRQHAEQLLQRLETREAAIRKQRDETREWIAQRQSELAHEAQQLRDRESELDRQSAEMRLLKLQWIEQRLRYEQELHRLRRQVHPA